MSSPPPDPVVVNYWKLMRLSSFGWLSNRELERLSRDVDPNSEGDVKAAIRDVLLPYLMKSPSWDLIREQLRLNLRYFLTTGALVEDVYEDAEPAFGLPDRPIDYYRWAWEVLFGEEPWHLESTAGYAERNDRRAV